MWPRKSLELREEGVPLTEMAVLFRSSFHSFDLEIELSKCDLPFVKRGGFKFIETTHVKDVLAHLRVLANPQDAVSWHRVLLLLEGVGPKSSDKILSHVLGGADQIQRLAEYPGPGRGQDRGAESWPPRSKPLPTPAYQPREQIDLIVHGIICRCSNGII